MSQDAPDYDIAIIGGGINGAGIARDAAMRGLKVLLLEKNDFGSGPSSWSSRLIHGGLRYLEYSMDSTRNGLVNCFVVYFRMRIFSFFD